MNSTSDQSIRINSGKYVIRRVIVTNASTSLTLAVGGIFTAAGKTGSQIALASQVYSALTSSSKYVDAALGSIVSTDVLTGGTIYFSLTTAQGSAATADIYIIGDDLES